MEFIEVLKDLVKDKPEIQESLDYYEDIRVKRFNNLYLSSPSIEIDFPEDLDIPIPLLDSEEYPDIDFSSPDPQELIKSYPRFPIVSNDFKPYFIIETNGSSAYLDLDNRLQGEARYLSTEGKVISEYYRDGIKVPTIPVEIKELCLESQAQIFLTGLFDPKDTLEMLYKFHHALQSFNKGT